MRKQCITLTALLLVLLSAVPLWGADYNYGEALQKSIFFYEAQQAGPLPEWNRVEWRGDATMNDPILGGLYDAGDHVKFNLPMAYTASMLGWAGFEYKDAFVASGQWQHLENNLRFILDYLLECWDGTSYTFQVGLGMPDHNWWGPAEVIHLDEEAGNRPALKASSGVSGVMAQSAAALALGYILFDHQPYLTEAVELFNVANADRSDSVYNNSDAIDFYKSWSGPMDEVLWGAIWLHYATGESKYLTIAESIFGSDDSLTDDWSNTLLTTRDQSNMIEYKWGHVWDNTQYGASVLMARLTGRADIKNYVHTHLDWWVAGANGKTPQGLSWLTNWGSLRHASTSAFLAFVYSDWDDADPVKASQYRAWAESQIDYILGDNERNGSYVVGYGTNSPQHPHHRTAHGSWSDQKTLPENHRHIIYGALVGGPSNSAGSYKDEIDDYQANEVACDYNAGFVGALAKMYSLNGGEPPADFPQPEEKEDEFFAEAAINNSGSNFTELKVLVNNRSGWPARTIKDLRFRYYLDLAEVIDAGYGPEDLTISTNYLEFDINISSIQPHSGTVYYLEASFTDGDQIYPGGQSPYAGEVQMRISAPEATTFWDDSNDWSRQELIGNNTLTRTPYIPIYNGTTLVYGQEPDGPATTPTPTPIPTPPPFVSGDANNDGAVDVLDALATARYSAGLETGSNFNPAAADADCSGSVNIIDALLIARYSVGLISTIGCP